MRGGSTQSRVSPYGDYFRDPLPYSPGAPAHSKERMFLELKNNPGGPNIAGFRVWGVGFRELVYSGLLWHIMVYCTPIGVILGFYGGHNWRTGDALSGITGLEPRVDVGISGFEVWG